MALLALAVVTAGLGIWTVRRALPDYAERLTIPGLAAPVTVVRDAYAVPQVYARTASDLFRAQGYLHAQERFWEMDFRRHVTAGRLAEMFGAAQVETDTFIRTLGWRRVAEAEWSLISPESRSALIDYAAGVNAWLAARGVLASPDAAMGEPNGGVSLEYSVLTLTNRDYRIERWTPVDSLAWLKAMAWDLRGNMEDEIDRAALLDAGLTTAQVDDLYPAYPNGTKATIVPGGTIVGGTFRATALASPAGAGALVPADYATPGTASRLTAIADTAARLPVLLGTGGAGIGSNSWVIGRARSATGAPILANDPHLGPSLPGVWMQMGLHCDCGLEVAGFTFSGLPGVVIGHNGRIAWGFTNLNPDVTDLFLEQVKDDRYRVGDAWEMLEVRQETLKVAGGDARTITIRSTRHGPLLSDVSEETRGLGGDAVALRWTALDPGRTIDALFALNRATGWDDFRSAAAKFEVPAQNLVYADVDGNIGYQSPGRIPVRGKGDGRLPSPGWDPAYDWTGYVPFDELPTILNPAQGFIVAANNAVAGPSYPRFLTGDWSYGYRAQRIHDLIGGMPKLSVDDVQRMQFDNLNTMAPQLVPALLAAPVDGTAAEARALLRDWDFQQTADSAPAAYFNAVWRQVLARTFDELPAGRRPDGGDRWFEVIRGLLAAPSSPWWDDKETPAVETSTDILRAAMTSAAEELTGRFGDDPRAWHWGELHTLTLRNQSFGTSGIAAVEWLFNAEPVETAGATDTINATGWSAVDGYEVDWVPSMRMIVDLGELDSSRWVNLSGVSGHAFSDHYTDQLELWRTGGTFPMRWTSSAVEAEAVTHQTLTP